MKIHITPATKTLILLAFVPLFLLLLGTLLSDVNRNYMNDPTRTPQTKTYFEMLKNMPLYWMGYLFGLIGGLFRGGVMMLREKFEPEVSVLLGQFIVGGIIGIMSAVFLQSNIIRIFLYGVPEVSGSDATSAGSATVSGATIVLVAFLLGMFASEVTDSAKKRLFAGSDADS